MLKNIPKYIIGVAIPLAIGALSALLTRGNMNIYSEIELPPLAPPSILFPIVWTVLYVLMGISSAQIFIDKNINPKDAALGLRYYAVSLFFNFFWSILFFNLRAFLISFIWLAVLLFLIIKTIIHYRKVTPWAAYLQIPYAVWVAFAGYLNFAIFLLNP